MKYRIVSIFFMVDYINHRSNAVPRDFGDKANWYNARIYPRFGVKE